MCRECGKEKTYAFFYGATNPLLSNDGKKVDICKTCIKKGSYNPDGSLNIENFKQKLMLMDKPFIPQALNSAMNEVNNPKDGKGHRTDIIGCYFKNISSLPQYSKLSFLESLELVDSGKTIDNLVAATDPKKKNKDEIYVRKIDDFLVTDEMLDLFGEGYTKDQYRRMTKKFNKLKENYSIQTNLHEEALATYVRFKVKEEEATALGDVAGADKWNRAAQDAADKAKLTPKQLTQADLQGGVTCISEISKACEQAVERVEI